jgi:hypothetical protein
MPAGAGSSGTILLLVVIGFAVVDLVPPLAIRFAAPRPRLAGVFVGAARDCELVPQTGSSLARRAGPPGDELAEVPSSHSSSTSAGRRRLRPCW